MEKKNYEADEDIMELQKAEQSFCKPQTSFWNSLQFADNDDDGVKAIIVVFQIIEMAVSLYLQ